MTWCSLIVRIRLHVEQLFNRCSWGGLESQVSKKNKLTYKASRQNIGEILRTIHIILYILHLHLLFPKSRRKCQMCILITLVIVSLFQNDYRN